MHSSLQFFIKGSQLGSHPISARLPLKLEDALSGPATDVSKTKEVKRLRCLSHAVLAVRPHIGQIRSGVSFPDATIRRTFPFAAAYLQRSVWLHPHARSP